MHFLIVWNIFFEMQHKRLFPDDETIPERERTDSRLKQSSYRSRWLTKEFIAFTYRSKGKRQLTESRMNRRQLATLKIPPGWQLTKTAILECNMTDWQTGGSSNQRAQHDWQTGGLTSQRLFCASPLIGLFLAIWLITFLPQWLVLVFLSWGWEAWDSCEF